MLKNLLFLEILIVVGSVIFHMASSRTTRRDIGHLPGIVLGSMAAIAFLAPSMLVAHLGIALVPLLLGRTKLKVGMIVGVGLFALPALPTNIVIGGAWLFQWTIQSTLAVSALIAFFIASGKPAASPPWADSAMIIVIMILVVVDARGGGWIGYFRQLAWYVFVYVIPIYIVTRSARNATEWRTLFMAMAGAGAILAIVILYEARAGWPLYAPIAPHLGIDVNGVFVKWRGGLMRAYGPMLEATNMGCVLVICFTAALAARRAFVSNMAYIAVLSIIALGSLAPQSRGGMIGIAVAFVVSSFYRRGAGSMGQVSLAALFLGGAYAGAMMIGSVGSQISTSMNEATGTGDYRSELLRRGLQEFWKSPLFGDNYTNVVSRMQDMVQGEGIVDFVNTYLYFALFSGAIGLFLFCIAFIIPMTRLAQIRRLLPANSDEREAGGFCLALLVSAAVMLVFTSYLQRPSIFFLIASSLAMMIRVPRRAASAPRLLPTADIKMPDDPPTAVVAL